MNDLARALRGARLPARRLREALPPARRLREALPPARRLREALPPARRSRAASRTLVILELGTGTAALAGGVLLAASPDGSLLRADPAALAGSPFTDWEAPGVLLATLVGGGFLMAGGWQLTGRRHARELSVLAGAGLIAFEAAELGWIGFHPLQPLFALVGAGVIALAWPRPQKWQ
jgi:hypothetical protein